MRTKNTLNNVLSSTGNMAITTILNFIYRTFFIQILGVEYLGVSAVFTNVLMMLSLAELGIGQAIAYSLYKPISEKNEKQINSLVCFYKKVYRYIGFGVIVLGIIFIPFIPFVLPNATNLNNLNLIFLLFLMNSSLTYFWGYKRTLIIADQKEYKIVPFIAVSQILDISLRILFLKLTGSFILVLLIQLCVKLIENIYINRYIDKTYTYLTDKGQKLLDTVLSEIKINIKAIIFHKFGNFVVTGTDNIIISMFVGVGVLGIFSNYTMLLGVATTFLMLVFNAASASFGNAIANQNEGNVEKAFNNINFISHWLFSLGSIGFYFLIQPFINLWIGSEYLLSNSIIILLTINFFLLGIRVPVEVVKSSAGLYNQDKYAPLTQGILNIVISLILVKIWGIEGVLLGTVLSSLAIPNWYRPYILYKYLFKKSPLQYFKKSIVFTILTFVIVVILDNIISTITFDLDSLWLLFFAKALICLVLPNVVFFIFYARTTEGIKLLSLFNPVIQKVLFWKS